MKRGAHVLAIAMVKIAANNMSSKKPPQSRFKAILLSGLPGSGKSTAVRELSLLLGWPLFSIGDMFRKQWQEKYPNAELAFEDYMKTITLKAHKEMDARARKVFEKGRIVGDMHHGAGITESLPGVLRVFVSAPLEIRAERAKKTGRFEGKSTKQIMRLLDDREQTILDVAKRIYGKSYSFNDPSRYHLVINSGLLTVKEKIAAMMSFFV